MIQEQVFPWQSSCLTAPGRGVGLFGTVFWRCSLGALREGRGEDFALRKKLSINFENFRGRSQWPAGIALQWPPRRMKKECAGGKASEVTWRGFGFLVW
jgi:hypothetical protein